ncbi:rolling circle replication-associated protein [Methanosarcina horonobensis]|nr:hypothetical protein [Methanosarcina horonobensis]
MNRINKFGFYNKDSKQFEYTTEMKNEIDSLFRDYCTRIKSEKIVLTRSPDGNPVFAQDIYVNYKTRFTDQGRQQENIEGFKRAYWQASHKHMKGVFLTLTAPSCPSKTLWAANTDLLQTWKKFQIFLTKILPDRADWICVREFQQNGRLHFHIMITGINWLATKKLIQYTWVKYGGGPILDIHTIHQDYRGWHWSRSCPLEAAGSEPQDFLESYLEKSMSGSGGSLYWVMGCRNWTCSKSLLPKKEKIHENKPVKPSKNKYFLKGVISALSGFRASRRKDSLSLFSGSLTSSKKRAIEQKAEQKIKKPAQNLSFRRATDLSYQC